MVLILNKSNQYHHVHHNTPVSHRAGDTEQDLNKETWFAAERFEAIFPFLPATPWSGHISAYVQMWISHMGCWIPAESSYAPSPSQPCTFQSNYSLCKKKTNTNPCHVSFWHHFQVPLKRKMMTSFEVSVKRFNTFPPNCRNGLIWMRSIVYCSAVKEFS